jgi:hypothetical protein
MINNHQINNVLAVTTVKKPKLCQKYSEFLQKFKIKLNHLCILQNSGPTPTRLLKKDSQQPAPHWQRQFQ